MVLYLFELALLQIFQGYQSQVTLRRPLKSIVYKLRATNWQFPDLLEGLLSADKRFHELVCHFLILDEKLRFFDPGALFDLDFLIGSPELEQGLLDLLLHAVKGFLKYLLESALLFHCEFVRIL